jgi:hypothetical protein
MGKEPETKTDPRADPAVAQDGSVALAALPRCQSSARFAPRTLNWEEGEQILFCAIIIYHFGPHDRRCWIDRSPFHVDTCGSLRTRIWGVERSAGRAAAILGQSDVARGRCFGFKFGRWLATSTERVRSRSPCGARVRDECTKRSGRSGWTVEHFVLLGCLTTRSFIEVHSFWRETMIQTALSNLQDTTDDDHWALRKSGQYTLVYGCLKYSKKRHFAPLFGP